MIDAGRLVEVAVSSTTTGGLPGPAAITRLPDCIAACTTAGPPVTHSSATSGMAEDLLGGLDARLGDAS